MNPAAMQQAMSMMGGAGGGGMPGMGGMGGMNPAMMQQMMGGGGMPGMGMPGAAGGGANPAAVADARPSREKYAEQLVQIKEMGFNDEDAILQILEQTGGNVQLALERLFQ